MGLHRKEVSASLLHELDLAPVVGLHHERLILVLLRMRFSCP